MNAIESALATLHPGTILISRMASPVTAVDYIIHAAECLRLNAIGPATTMTGRALDVATRHPFKRNAKVWRAALDELAQITGAVKSPALIDLRA